jgi:hypothetical protein
MTKDEARQLRKGDRVIWLSRICESIGTVIEANYVSFVIKWDRSEGYPICNYAINGDDQWLAVMQKFDGLSSH